MKVLVTGAKGFICGYVIETLLSKGWSVVGLDNFSKYGAIEKSYDAHPNYKFIEGDAKNVQILKDALADCDHFIAAAAMIGGISYFHEYAYDLISENERITASAFDAAIWAHKNKKLKKITVISSSMVYENATKFPTPEGHQFECPPPFSTYGFQKLAVEYYVRGAAEQYQLPYTILRPFNCVGIGEKKAASGKYIKSGNIELAFSHVVPDLAQKILKGQDPVSLLGSGGQLRHYTYGGDLAKGIVLSLDHPKALNNDFNLSTDKTTSVLELAEMIWKRANPKKPFRYVTEKPFKYDVQKRIPDVAKARDLLGFTASTGLDAMLDEIIPWIQTQIELGGI